MEETLKKISQEKKLNKVNNKTRLLHFLIPIQCGLNCFERLNDV